MSESQAGRVGTRGSGSAVSTLAQRRVEQGLSSGFPSGKTDRRIRTQLCPSMIQRPLMPTGTHAMQNSSSLRQA